MPIPTRPTDATPNIDAPGTHILTALTPAQQDTVAKAVSQELLTQGFTWKETDNILRRSLQLMIQKF